LGSGSKLTDPADTPSEPGHIMQCLTTHSLPGGQLTTQTLRIYPGLTERSVRVRGAITGGSGEYQTARGEVENRNQGEQTIITFQLILTP
jgi:hypothetical protein